LISHLLRFFLFSHPVSTYTYTLSLHDALPIFLTLISGCFYQFHISCEPTIFKQFSNALGNRFPRNDLRSGAVNGRGTFGKVDTRSEEHTSELQSRIDLVCRLLLEKKK